MELVTGHQATPHITAEQVSRLLQGVTTMDDTTVYRLPIGNNCAVSVSSLDVSIDTGEIVLHGFHTTFEESYTVTLDPTINAAKSRIDKIVMEIIEDLTTGIQTANIEVVQGEESSSPVAPATPVAPTSPTEKFLAVGVIATVTVSNITIASSVDNTELYAGSYVTDEMFKIVRRPVTDEYDSTKAYTKGEYTIHDNKLYVCTSNCSAAAWNVNQSNFSQTSLTAMGTALNSEITTLNSDLIQLIADGAEISCDYYMSGTTGSYALDGNYLYFVVAGNMLGYSMCLIVNDSTWYIHGTNNLNLSITGDTLNIPQWARIMIIKKRLTGHS